MGIDNGCILDNQFLPGEYFCPVCGLLINPHDALRAACSHLYCRPCLTYIARTTQACPNDGCRVTESDCKALLDLDGVLADAIGKIKVRCLYYRSGCTWQGSLSDCTSHCSTCAFGEYLVVCNRCAAQVVHRQVHEHTQHCPGVPFEAQQPSVLQAAGLKVDGVHFGQMQTIIRTGAPACQARTSDPFVSCVVGNLHVDASAPQQAAQAAQATFTTPQDWYHHQQQCERPQYLQQYYFPYFPPGLPYPQQHFQGCPPQVYGQAWPQVYCQGQPGHQLQAQQQVLQPQVQTQPQAQAAVNVKPHVQSVRQAQTHVLLHGQAPPSQGHLDIQSQSLPQAQQYAQPQPIPQQQMPLHQNHRPCPQIQLPLPPPYPQPQIQRHSHPQSQVQVQSQLYPPPTAKALENPSTQANQSHNAVMGHQSCLQGQPHPQPQVGAACSMQAAASQEQVKYPGGPGQTQGQRPLQASQVYPPQPRPSVPNQPLPAELPARAQAPSGTSTLRPGDPFHQCPGVLAAQQSLQRQSLSVQDLLMQRRPPIKAHLHAQRQSLAQWSPQICGLPHGAQPNTDQHYPGQQIVPEGAGSEPYAPGAALAGAGQGSSMPMNHTHPMRATTHLPSSSSQQKNDLKNLEGRDKTQRDMVSSAQFEEDGIKKVKSEKRLDGGMVGNENKKALAFPSTGEVGIEPKLVEHGVQQVKSIMKENTLEGISAPSTGGNTVNQHHTVLDFKHPGKGVVGASPSPSMLPQSHSVCEMHGSYSYPPIDQGRNQPQPMLYGPLASQRPGIPLPYSMLHTSNPQQPALLGHPHSHLRPQEPGQFPPCPLFNAADNFQPSIPGHPFVSMPHDNPSEAVVRPASSGTLGQPCNLGDGQGPVPTFQVVQSQNRQGKPFIRPSSTGQNYCAFDSHGGVLGREPLHRPGNIEQLPPCPVGNANCPSQKAGYFEGSIHPYGTTERGPFVPAGPGVPGAVELGSPSAHGSISVPYVRDERCNLFPQENLQPFSGPNDKHPYGSGRHSGLRTEPGIDPGFSKILPLSHQAAGFRDDKSRKNGHPERRFNRSRRDGLPPRNPAPFGRSIRGGRFPVSSNSLSSVDLDVPGCLHQGNHLQRSERISPHNLHLGQVTALAPSGGLVHTGQPSLPERRPFGESSGGENPGHSHSGEDGFRSRNAFQHRANDSGFHPMSICDTVSFSFWGKEPFDNPRKRKVGSIVGLNCEVDCDTVASLESHSQSRDHQRKATDMALSTKEQNKKKHRASNDPASVQEGKDEDKP